MTADDVLLAALIEYRRRGGGLEKLIALWLSIFGHHGRESTDETRPGLGLLERAGRCGGTRTAKLPRRIETRCGNSTARGVDRSREYGVR